MTSPVRSGRYDGVPDVPQPLAFWADAKRRLVPGRKQNPLSKDGPMTTTSPRRRMLFLPAILAFLPATYRTAALTAQELPAPLPAAQEVPAPSPAPPDGPPARRLTLEEA